MKRLLAISVLLAAAVTSLISCGETKEADDHANWKSRNIAYISGIAAQCTDLSLTPEAASEGQMFRILSYKLDPEKSWGANSYVYCKVLKKGTGTVSPYYSDSIRINYRMRLMPTDNYPEGQVIDRSFMTAQLDPGLNVPASFKVASLIDGVISALSHMHCGDYWIIYVPYSLGYGTSSKTGIPGCSSLIYELNLTEIAPTGTSLSPR